MGDRRWGPGDDVEFIQTPNDWPRWPFLPMKRWRGSSDGSRSVMDTGIIHISNLNKVVITNLYGMPTTFDEFTKLPNEEFRSADEIVAAGWVVD